MKKIYKLGVMVILMTIPFMLKAQYASTYKLTNFKQVNETTLQFDLEFHNTGTTDFGLQAAQCKISLNQLMFNGQTVDKATSLTCVSTDLVGWYGGNGSSMPSLAQQITVTLNNGYLVFVTNALPFVNYPVIDYFPPGAYKKLATINLQFITATPSFPNTIYSNQPFAEVSHNIAFDPVAGQHTAIRVNSILTANGVYYKDNTLANPNYTAMPQCLTVNLPSNAMLSGYCFTGPGNYSDVTKWNNATSSTITGYHVVPSSTNNAIINGNCSQDQNVTINNLNITSGSTLSVNAAKQLTVSTGLTNNGIMNLLSENTSGTATILTPATLVGNGTYNVNQFMTGSTGTSTRGMWYISSPVSGATSSVFDVVNSSPLNKLWSYSESLPTPAYVAITTNGTPLTPGTGYVANFAGADANYTFTGSLNTENITLTPTRTGTSASRGFNLIGNPYPAYLNWNAAKAVSTNLRPTIWYRTFVGGFMVFGTYDGSVGTNNASQYIPPMQAVWVKGDVDNVACSLPLSNTMCSHQDQTLTTNRLRVPAKDGAQILRLQVSNGVISDEAIVITDTKAKNGFDYYDSQKMSNNNVAIPEIYTLAGTEELVINHLKEIELNDGLALGFRTGQYNTFTISATQVNNFDADIRIILNDNLLNVQKDITDGASYTFTSDVVATTSRFSIIFKSASITTEMNNQLNNTQSVLINKGPNNNIIVNYNGDLSKTASLSVCTVIGQKLITKQLTNSTTEISNLPTGVYLVNVTIEGKTFSQKVILN